MILGIENKKFYLDYIKAGKNILKTISEKYGRVRYFDPSTKIVSTLNLLSDRYHPNVEGNKQIAKEMGFKHVDTFDYRLSSQQADYKSEPMFIFKKGK